MTVLTYTADVFLHFTHCTYLYLKLIQLLRELRWTLSRQKTDVYCADFKHSEKHFPNFQTQLRSCYCVHKLIYSLQIYSSTHPCVCQWNEVIISRNTILFGSTLWESDNRDKGGVILDGNRDFQRRPETPFNNASVSFCKRNYITVYCEAQGKSNGRVNLSQEQTLNNLN